MDRNRKISSVTAATDEELLHIETAIGIDLILKKILLILDLKDLLSARLVSHRWNLIATKITQKRTKVTFNYTNENYYDYWRSNSGSNPSLNLRSLTTLMEHSKELSFEFPVISYELYPAVLSDEILTNFLRAHGSHIKRLKLYLKYTSQELYELSSLGHLHNLLVEHTPLLNFFEVHCDISEDVVFLNSYSVYGNENENNQLSSMFQGPHSKSKSGKNELLENLHVLKMTGDVHQGILEGLLDEAKNLQEVRLDNENLHYLMEPLNRLHLLQSVTFDLDSMTSASELETMEILASNHEHLRIRKLALHFNPQTLFVQQNWPRVTSALNEIMWSSHLTLESVTWGPIEALQRGAVEIPKMSKLRNLTLEIVDFKGNCDEVARNRNEDFFHKDFNIPGMFPRLTNVFIVNGWMGGGGGGGGYGLYGYDINYSDYFSHSVPSPVSISVQYLYIYYSSQNIISEKDSKELPRIFPNAHLKFWP